MSKALKKEFCNCMFNFIKEHINEIKDMYTYKYLGFKGAEDMLKQIKTDFKIAEWALTELCCWGFKECYFYTHFLVETNEDYNIYKINDKYISLIYDNNVNVVDIHKMKQITKIIEVKTWEVC